MRVEAGSLITLDIEKPAVGGRMLARHKGQVVLVWGAIPGEQVRARVERAGRGVLYAEVADVLTASADRRPAEGDWRCGGNAYAHVTYDRQVRLKGEIIRETLGRIGRLPLDGPPVVVASPERGYRMRARLHAADGRLGFLREGTHQLCDPGQTGQLLPQTLAWITRFERFLADRQLSGVTAVDLTENIAGDERACHLEVAPDTDPGPFASFPTGSTVTDTLRVLEDDAATTFRLRRHARSFFQGNRFLLEPLVRHVAALVPEGPVVDLYAGVGLFGLALAAAGMRDVTLVEGDAASGADLEHNAAPFGAVARVERCSVETFLAGGPRASTVIVDPPRTGLSKDAIAGIVRVRPVRIVYVSCDIATLARDTRSLVDAGWGLDGLTGFDLFPNTAHVESVAVLTYRSPAALTNPSNSDRNSPVR
jgi:23S rRNA (uracil1939-C5)-methyltransferase